VGESAVLFLVAVILIGRLSVDVELVLEQG
jgi:hypothetical protein